MGNSLRDELLKAGLVTEEQVERSRTRARRPAKRGRKKKGASPAASEEPVRPAPGRHGLRVNRQRAAKFARDPSLAGNTTANSEKKALRERMRKLIEANRLNDANADVPFNFMRGKRIKRLYVTAEQRQRLLADELAIAGVEGNHHLLPVDVAEQLAELAPNTFIHRAGPGSREGSSEDPDYGEHPVPDDITW